MNTAISLHEKIKDKLKMQGKEKSAISTYIGNCLFYKQLIALYKQFGLKERKIPVYKYMTENNPRRYYFHSIPEFQYLKGEAPYR